MSTCCRTRPVMNYRRPAKRRRSVGSTSMMLLATAVALWSLGCGSPERSPTFDPRQCAAAQLDEVPDLEGLFSAPDTPCVIVAWDTGMEGAALRPDGGIGTPPALAATARAFGFASPCETTLSPAGATFQRSWFVGRFGALDPRAQIWGVTLFVPTAIPEGIQPACAAIEPPR